MNALKILMTLMLLLTISACQKAESEQLKIKSSAIPDEPKKATPPAHIPTIEEWNEALKSTYTESDSKDGKDGTRVFYARFPDQTGTFFDAQKKSGNLSRVTRDGFRKMYFFKNIWPDTIKNLVTNVSSYISLPDGGKPTMLLRVYFNGRNGWLFMNKVAVMLDGEVILENDFSKEQVERNTTRPGIEETYTFIADASNIAALRKIKPTSKVIIRITGDKGYVNVDGDGTGKSKEIDATEVFIDSIMRSLAIYDTLNMALENHIPPKK
ncbi:hypothetical protein H8K38_16175 [Undibacterium sp. FT79W]|uniref:hypothetical protein n=1 Tax=Undibacterium sp. FT79W TaxID=2762296 RepID=UPI00164C19DC|nr:hypothetical protein [Undibacterium sp. FT79W]MBC3879348.1 hypothetical protein [Undibacterium sp. FT79W]